jgi:hypothetical protein
VTALAPEALLHGPRLPVAVQTAAWIARPWEFMRHCAARYGDRARREQGRRALTAPREHRR